jgi:23S rRNA (cytosine1962-C5)-methyltransferase
MNRQRRNVPSERPHQPGMIVREGAYRLPDDVARRVRSGHPWVFREALAGRAMTEPTGALVDLMSGNGTFLARGYVDKDHSVAVRVLSCDAKEKIHPGAGTIAKRLHRAVQLRWLVLGPDRPTALRLFTGENEGFPGVTVDRYGEFVVVQWYSAGALPWRDELLEAITEAVHPRGIYEQKRLRPLGGQAPAEPAARASGEQAPLEVVVEEAGCRFAIDVTAPLGVGFFIDMRLGRDSVAKRAAERRVLNLFSYTGAFSVRAAKAGAVEVVAVDTSAKAHARARRNYELSGLDPARMEQITSEASKTLERFLSRKRSFDIVICDPPTFAHGQGPGRTFSAASDLAELAGAAGAVLAPGGLLAFANNSAKLSAAEVDRALAEGAAQRGFELRIIERQGLPPDFPVHPGFPEGNYLKFVLAVRVP